MAAKVSFQAWENIASTPVMWLKEAEMLRAVAETVARRWGSALRRSRPERRKRATTKFADPSDFGRAFMMLAGYALEVLAKGVIIAQRPNEVRERWKRRTHGHDLVALLGETG